jgi:purine-binding chemotaxis protein CheW
MALITTSHEGHDSLARLDQRRVLLFDLSGQAYAISVLAIREIVPLAMLSQPPGLPPLIAGFLNLGGTSVAVVRTARLFGLPERETGLYTPLLILRDTQLPLALLVDHVSGIVSVADADVVPIRDHDSFNACAEGMISLGGQHAVLLSPERVLLEEERHRIRELAAAQQARLDEIEGAAS